MQYEKSTVNNAFTVYFDHDGVVAVTCAAETVENTSGTVKSINNENVVIQDENSVAAETNDATQENGADNLYTKVVDNGDGTSTVTLYGHPVKFINDSGETEDISLEIAAASDGTYRTAAAESQTVFPKTISDGITLSGNGVNLKLTPAKLATSGTTTSMSASNSALQTVNTSVIKLDNETVSYAYDSKTTLEYSLTYTGFKEDIVVSEYTGQTEYHFLLETGGLSLTKIDGSYYLTDANGNDIYAPGVYEVYAYAQGADDEWYLIHGCPVTYTNHGVYRDPSLPNYTMKDMSEQLLATFEMNSNTVSFDVCDKEVLYVTPTGQVIVYDICDMVITAAFTDPDTGVTRTDEFIIRGRDHVGLSDGTTYYIMNKVGGRFLSLETAADADGINIVTVPRSTATQVKWTIDIDGYKVATLTNAFSTVGRTLAVDGSNVELSASADIGDYKFAVYRSGDETYSGLYCIRYGPYFVTQDSAYNVVLTPIAHAGSFWSFVKVDKGTASMISFNYTPPGESNYNSSTNSDNFLNTFNGLGFTTSSDIKTSLDNAFSKLLSSDIFLYSGHGNNSVLSFKGKEGSYAKILADLSQVGGVSQPNIKTINNNVSENQLNQARCVFYLGCNTGLSASDGSNLVDYTFDKGAHFVFGVCDETSYQVGIWLPHFFNFLTQGNNIEDAIDKADKHIEEFGNGTDKPTSNDYFARYYVGDTSQYLYIQ